MHTYTDMKLALLFIAAVNLASPCICLAGKYDDLTGKGYRWVIADGPYACTAEEDVLGIVTHHTDANELQVIEDIRCYYLVPGTIVKVITEDPATGMSRVFLPSVTTPLWTYTSFLSKHPVKDTYGVIETP